MRILAAFILAIIANLVASAIYDSWRESKRPEEKKRGVLWP